MENSSILSGEFLDLSLDEAEVILEAAKAVIGMRDRSLHAEGAGEAEPHAVSAELDENAEVVEVEPSDEMTAEGYDEAVESGAPFSAELDVVDPPPMTETDLAADEIVLQEPSRDLRPDTITPAPDLGATEIPSLENVETMAAEIMASDEELASAEDHNEATDLTPAVSEDAASSGSPDEEKH